MDQELKQRIVGAVVITSLAVIFVPMLFDDPINQTGKMIGGLEIPPLPVKVFESELAQLPKSTDDVTSLPKPKVIKQLEDNNSVNKMQSWFIQLGVFGSESNAIAFQKKIKEQGFSARIKSIKAENGVLYRVSVGPELDKKRAEQLKQKIDKLNGIKSILSLADG